MMRKTLAPRIGYSEASPAYEWNLLDALMKPVCFDVSEYIADEIRNIATNPLISCGFTPYIQYMIEVVTCEKFCKDIAHELLCPIVTNDTRPHASSSTPAVAPSCSTRSGGASSASSTNTGFLKMFRGIFTMCRCIDQRMDVMEQCL
jgi:hypothetical protein